MVTDDGCSSTVRTPREGGIECSPVDAGEREGAMEGPSEWPFGRLTPLVD